MVNEERRSFLRWAVQGLGAVFAAVLGLPALAYMVDARNRPAPQRDFRRAHGITMADLEAHRDMPIQGVIRDVRRDAWTLSEDVVGRVWAVKTSDGIKVFTTICPHLGCSVNVNLPGFECPCHGGKFNIDGSLDLTRGRNPAPRGMDTLVWQADPDDPNLLQVKYVDYIQSRHDKVPKA
jgi:menaquinol-cytochrome c reductase iron-sulfur subunit